MQINPVLPHTVSHTRKPKRRGDDHCTYKHEVVPERRRAAEQLTSSSNATISLHLAMMCIIMAGLLLTSKTKILSPPAPTSALLAPPLRVIQALNPQLIPHDHHRQLQAHQTTPQWTSCALEKLQNLLAWTQIGIPAAAREIGYDLLQLEVRRAP